MRIPYEDNDISLSSVDHLLADIETVSTSLGTDYAAQIRLLLERAPQWISLNLIAAVVLAYALWAHVPNHLLAPWLVFMTATSALHVFLTNYFARAGSTVSQLPTRSKIHQFMIASNGLAWGIGIWFMLPALADDLRFAACAIVFGVTLVSIPSLASVSRMHTTFACGALIPLVAWHASRGDAFAPLTLLLCACVVAVLMVARSYGAVARKSYDVAFEFGELVHAFSARYKDHRLAADALRENLADVKIRLGKASEDRDRSLSSLRAIGEAVLVANREGNIDFINPIAEVLTGWSAAEVVGRPLASVFTTVNTTTREKPEDPVEKCMRTQSVVVSDDNTALIRKDGLRYAIEHVGTPMRDARGGFCGMVLIFRDVTERRREVSKITWRATHDPLTGLINRSEFESRVVKLLEQPGRSGRSHALCYFDLDRFKLINDSYGHNVGNAFLKGLADMLRVRIRGADTLARLGGDEFAVLLYSCPVDKARIIADGLRKLIEDFEFALDHETLAVGASVGVVEIDDSVASLTEVFSAADAACYVAKNKGRNRVHVHESAHADPPRRELSVLPGLQRALARNDFSLFYQAIHPLTGNGNLRYCELLLRVKNADNDLIPPHDYLKAAERYHLLPKIDQWMVNAALDSLRLRHPALAKMDTVTLNLSGQSLNDDRFLEFLLSRVEEEDVPGNQICFQLSETGLIANPDRARYFITALQNAGCRFALDDCGFGVNSFSLLISLDIDFIKIAEEFVRNIEYSSVDFEIVVSLVRVARTMGIQTIAHGVSTESACATLQGMGVNLVQGPLIDKPRPLQIG